MFLSCVEYIANILYNHEAIPRKSRKDMNKTSHETDSFRITSLKRRQKHSKISKGCPEYISSDVEVSMFSPKEFWKLHQKFSLVIIWAFEFFQYLSFFFFTLWVFRVVTIWVFFFINFYNLSYWFFLLLEISI